MIGEILIIAVPRLYRGRRTGAQIVELLNFYIVNKFVKLFLIACFSCFILFNGATRIEEHLTHRTSNTLVFDPLGTNF